MGCLPTDLHPDAPSHEDGRDFWALIENMGDIVARFDRACRYLYLSSSGAGLLGMEPAAAMGRNHLELGFSPADCARWDEAISRVFETGLAEEQEESVDLAGIRRIFLWRLAPDIDRKGTVRSVVAVARDITESRYAQLRLAAYSTRMQEMARRLVQAHENERHNIAGDLHDLMGQNLTALGINIDIVRSELPQEVPVQVTARLARMKALVDETIDSVRMALKDLLPHTLNDYGLVAALHSYASHFGGDRQFSVTLSTRGPERRMAPAVELALFRIAQEAVANAARHSGATAARVELISEPSRLSLVIEDEGRGFRTDVERRSRTRSLGLMLMQERADAAGVMLTVDSAPGKGTCIKVEVSGTALERGDNGVPEQTPVRVSN